MTVSDESWAAWERELNIPIPKSYEYLVLADATKARIYVSKEGEMPRNAIAAQLRRLAEYLDSLTDEQARR